MASETNDTIAARGASVLVGNYRPQPITLVRGQGCRVEDAEGNRYLDLMGGIATTVLGHCHPALVRALDEQAHRIWHVSNI